MTTYTFDDALTEAAAELSLPSTHPRVDRLATLNFAYLSARRQWAQDQAAGSLQVMYNSMERLDAFRKEVGAVEPLSVTVRFVEGATGLGTVTCPSCGHTHRHEFAPGSLDPLPQRPPIEKPVVVEAAPSTTPPKDNVVPLDTSRLHYGSENSFMGGFAAPAGGNTAAGLAFNDPNPTRRQ
jgi:hypothetical protein